MRPQIVKILTFLLFILNSITMLAQERSGPPSPREGRLPVQASVDSYILILLIIGILYGAYKKHQLKDSLQ